LYVERRAVNTTDMSRHTSLGVVLCVCGLAVAGSGRSLGAIDSTPTTIVKHFTEDVVVNADGTSQAIRHGELQATNDSAAREIAQVRFRYQETLEDYEIVDAVTRKADGRELPVSASAIFVQTPADASSALFFSDTREKVVVFPDVGPGDTVVYTVRRTDKFAWPGGNYTLGRYFPRTRYVEDWRETVLLPKSMPATVESHAVAYASEDRGDTILHSWTYRQTAPIAEDRAEVSAWDYAPRFFLSTFKDADALAEAYARFTRGKATVTPRIQALADQLTAAVDDRLEQARTLYEWVTTHVRYVAIFIGTGTLAPHDADLVLANGYGDCKDHTILLKALLAAKGIASEVVLINSGYAYSRPTVPTLRPFNHAITYLPDFAIYVDSTSEVGPFGILSFNEYDKPVLHIDSAGPALRRTPPLADISNEASLETAEILLPDGRIVGSSTMTASGPLSASLRRAATRVEAAGPAIAARRLRALGQPGTGEFTFAPPRQELARSYSIHATFELDADATYLAGRLFAPRVGLSAVSRPGQTLLGPSEADPAEPTDCYSGRQREEIKLTLPEGYEIESLPRAMRIDNRWFNYRSRWEQTERTVTVYRELNARLETNLCSGEMRRIFADALTRIETDYRTAIRLKPASPSPVHTSLPPAGERFRDCTDCPEMVVIPPGQFAMGTGSDTERPQHTVRLGAPLGVGRYHVTRGQYESFVAATGRPDGSGCHVSVGGQWDLDAKKSWRDPGFEQSDSDPVVCVSWQDARAYAAWLSKKTGRYYRLLTEAEWEYAARAGTSTARWWGDDVSPALANCKGCGTPWDDKGTAPAGSFPANPFDLSDMLGNAWQWVEDCWADNYSDAASDASIARASGDCSRRTLRGGSWSVTPWYLRASTRYWLAAEKQYSNAGFRVALP
jgi:formylglycine-generating enzyme required for sulfatase activity/transglutaminase-like putative cysteine protease